MLVLLRVLAGLAGAALLVATIHAILASMLVPRPMTPRLTRLASAPSRAAFRFLALRRLGVLVTRRLAGPPLWGTSTSTVLPAGPAGGTLEAYGDADRRHAH